MSNQLSQLLPYGVGVVAVIAVSLFLAQAFLTELVKAIAAKTPSATQRLLVRSRPVGGRKLQRYRRMILDRYSKHKLGFGEGDEGQPIDISAVYIPLTYVKDSGRADAHTQMRSKRRTVLIGEPGAGKSLLVKNSMIQWAREGGDQKIPVMIDLHQCNTNADTFEQLITAEFSLAKVRHAQALTMKALDDGRLRVFFDGLDEVGESEHDRVVRALRKFAVTHDKCQIVVTCRGAVYSEQLDEEFDQIIRLADFDDASIIRFLSKWPGIEGPLAVGRIFQALQSDPQLMGLARSPLMLTMIAYLQSDARVEMIGPLPNSRSAFYETAVTHLLDRDRRLGRPQAIGMYTAERKMLVLERVARDRMESASTQGDRQEITRAQLVGAIKEMLPGFDLGPEHAEGMLAEIVNRSQLLKPLDRINSHYGFSHLTLLEYLAARALYDNPQRLLRNYRAAPSAWRETVRMWCAGARVDCTPVVREVFAAEELRQKVLALQCLADAVHIDATLADDVLSYFVESIEEPNGGSYAVVEGLGTLAASSRPRGTRVLGLLIAAAQGGPGARRTVARLALSLSGRLEAAEALARCAEDPVEGEARAALQSMGEIAVPALATAVGRGATWAVHSLGVVGTPAAAQQLGAALWAHREDIARDSAWTLAQLMRNPDVEEGLRQMSLPGSYDPIRGTVSWVWKPFEHLEPAGSSMPTVAGRIAYLLAAELEGGDPSHGQNGAPIEVTSIDHRLGIPLFAVGASKSHQPLAARWRAARQMARQLGPEFRQYSHRQDDIAAVFYSDHAALAESVEALAPIKQEILRVRQTPTTYCRILDLLPWPVQTLLLATCIAPRHFHYSPARMPRSVGEIKPEVWAAVRDNPPQPLWWERLTWTFVGLVLLPISILGLVRIAISCLGWMIWGLGAVGIAWINWLALVAVLLIIPWFMLWDKLDKDLPLFIGMFVFFGCFLYIEYPGLVTAAELVGWIAAITYILVHAVVATVTGAVAARRNAARANALRPILLKGESL